MGARLATPLQGRRSKMAYDGRLSHEAGDARFYGAFPAFTSPESTPMTHGRMLARARAALALLTLALGLGACQRSGTGADPANLPGSWTAQIEMGQQRSEYRLDITPAGYTWTEEVYGPAGRPADGLTVRVVHAGAWEVRGDRLALHQERWTVWTHPEGEADRTHVPAWDENNRIKTLRGNHMTILFDPPPHVSYLRPPLHFERTR
jgi:hypothetical protein